MSAILHAFTAIDLGRLFPWGEVEVKVAEVGAQATHYFRSKNRASIITYRRKQPGPVKKDACFLNLSYTIKANIACGFNGIQDFYDIDNYNVV